jgi:leucyl-tRNA synthetase
MKAVLANEEVTGEGRSVEGNHPVVKRPHASQWMLRITAVRRTPDRRPRNWLIGPTPSRRCSATGSARATGAEVDFQVVGGADKIRVYTTRPDTLFGATYMVLAPGTSAGEHHHHACTDRICQGLPGTGGP